MSCVDTARAYHPGVNDSGENCHAFVPVLFSNHPIVFPPGTELAVRAVVLCGLVCADVDRFAVQLAVDEWVKLCEESGSDLSLLDHQTIVRGVLLCSRFRAAVRAVLLFGQTICSEVVGIVRRATLLSIEIQRLKRGGPLCESRTEHRTLRLRFRFSGRRVARARTAVARDGVGDFNAGKNCCVCRAPR